MPNTWTGEEVVWYRATHNKYKVDKLGNVYLLDGERIKKAAEDKDGYLFYTFHVTKTTHFSVRAARVVWEAWRGEIPEGFVVDHINGDRKDNRISNLQLLTPEENVRKARSQPFCFIHKPSNIVASGTNVAKFCRTVGLCSKRMSEVKTGKRESYLGWENHNE